MLKAWLKAKHNKKTEIKYDFTFCKKLPLDWWDEVKFELGQLIKIAVLEKLTPSPDSEVLIQIAPGCFLHYGKEVKDLIMNISSY